MTTENWLKGGRALSKFKDAVIPSLKKHYSQKSIDWNTGDDHLKDLLDQKATHQVKKKKECQWSVSCLKCQPLLKMIKINHRRPARLMWTNAEKDVSCTKGYRLAKLFMSGGYEKSKDYSDLDALAVLEILRNDTSFGISEQYKDEIADLIMFRNRLMHSSSNRISAEELEDIFSIMKNLLEDDRFKNLDECKAAVKELDKLQQVNVICEVDESNEIWKQAKSIQKQALGDVEQKILSPEVLSILLTKMGVEYHKEKMQQLESELSELKKRIIYEQSQREQERSQREQERIQREQERRLREQERMQREIEQQKNKMLECQLKNSNEEIGSLKLIIEEMIAYTPTFTGRVFKGTATGTGIGLFGGPAGAAIGATAGGVVGGISYLWDKIRN